jgi:hypothetical protein
MGRGSQQHHFARPFEEIWQCSPFHPADKVAKFLDRFMEAGRFNAERFWEYVASHERLSEKKRPMMDPQTLLSHARHHSG